MPIDSAWSIELTYVDKSESAWMDSDFYVEFDRVAVPSLTVPDLTLSVDGAHARNYVYAASRVNIGRCAEVRDDRNRLIRTNQVAIADAAISRSHAHIECSDDLGDNPCLRRSKRLRNQPASCETGTHPCPVWFSRRPGPANWVIRSFLGTVSIEVDSLCLSPSGRGLVPAKREPARAKPERKAR